MAVENKKLSGAGLNQFGFFKYDQNGILTTPITPEHTEFMVDTGIISLDCHMVGEAAVGAGLHGKSVAAKVSIVNEYGYCLYDKFVKPRGTVINYRTQFSGIRPKDLKDATPFDTVKEEVSALLKNHILVGHSVEENDLASLELSHPQAAIRDTAEYFKRIYGRRPGLKMLVKAKLNIDLPQGEHSSIGDAHATMAIYQACKTEIEQAHRRVHRDDVLKQILDEFKKFNLASN